MLQDAAQPHVPFRSMGFGTVQPLIGPQVTSPSTGAPFLLEIHSDLPGLYFLSELLVQAAGRKVGPWLRRAWRELQVAEHQWEAVHKE